VAQLFNMKSRRRKIQSGRAKVTTHRKLSAAWNRCARASVRDMFQFLQAIQYKVPSGMSIGSLIPIGRLIRAAGIPGLNSGIVRGKYTAKGAYSSPFNRPKSPSHGRDLGQLAINSGKTAVKYGTPDRMIFTFRFTNVILQWALAGNPAMAAAAGVGQTTFISSWKKEMTRLPRELGRDVMNQITG